jgi:hypothetical protein
VGVLSRLFRRLFLRKLENTFGAVSTNSGASTGWSNQATVRRPRTGAGRGAEPRAVIGDEGYNSNCQPPRRATAQHRSGHSIQIQRQEQARLRPQGALQSPCTHCRQTQALQTYRATLRENREKLPLLRPACRWLQLAPIRPQDLGDHARPLMW